MKFIGILFLLSGWMLTMVAIVLLPRVGTRTAFLAAGGAVEAVGLALIVRAHRLAIEGD